ncbi:zinc-ribbon domain-containing protein [Roseobacter sp.]|uniref:zinc-ribbon domain-containing protein n=1 Tax=Roseobacter sp. TaxID=1907202 RepID=UPI003296A87A
MRLICPNCDAQYEVPDDVMPPQGRDVQCSNCDHTWFQVHPDGAGPDTAGPVDDASAPEPARADPQPAPPDAPSKPTRRSLDPNIADVLRQEAALETRARQTETTAAVESQPDLGLDIAAPTHDAPPPPPTEMAPTPTAVTGGSRDLLPDIAQINSTLRSNNNRSANDDPGQTAQVEIREKRSFGRGFMAVVAVTLICVLAYAFAPELAQAVPETDPWLSAYVGIVDDGRVWLDGQITAALRWLDSVTASNPT